MADKHYQSLMHTLDENREELVHRVTEQLFTRIPIVGISSQDMDPSLHHHRNMALTAERFHEIVQTGATIDWKLVTAEFGWADRKLSTMGITHDHHQILITTYFAEALQLRDWSPEERKLLEQIASNIREAAISGYDEPVPSSFVSVSQE